MTHRHEKEEPSGHIDAEFLGISPEAAYRQILEADARNERSVIVDLAEPLGHLDRWLEFLVGAIQTWYRHQDKWLDRPHMRAAAAMGTSSFNVLLLARRAALAGYVPEFASLIRECHERWTRAALFISDSDAAEWFLRDGEMEQAVVDRRLEVLNQGPEGEAWRALRQAYGHLSGFTHPSLALLRQRTPGAGIEAFDVDGDGDVPQAARDEIGVDATLGGLTSRVVILAAMVRVAAEARDVAYVLIQPFGDPNAMKTWQGLSDELDRLIERRLPPSNGG